MTDKTAPAFPSSWHPDMGWSPREQPEGMTLRQYAAIKAMQGLCSATTDGNCIDILVRDAVKTADALLAELEKSE